MGFTSEISKISVKETIPAENTKREFSSTGVNFVKTSDVHVYIDGVEITSGRRISINVSPGPATVVFDNAPNKDGATTQELEIRYDTGTIALGTDFSKPTTGTDANKEYYRILSLIKTSILESENSRETSDTGLEDVEVDERRHKIIFTFSDGRKHEIDITYLTEDVHVNAINFTDNTRVLRVSLNDGTVMETQIPKTTHSTLLQDMPNSFTDSQDGYVLRIHKDGNAQNYYVDDLVGELKEYVDNHEGVGPGTHAQTINVDNGKIVIGLTDDTFVSSNQFIPNPGNANGSRDLVASVRASNGKVNMTSGTSTDVTGLINSLSPTVDNNKRVDGQHIQTNTIPEDRLASAVRTKLNSSGDDNNDALEALVADMEWSTQVQGYDNAGVPGGGNEIGFAYKLSGQGHEFDFIFPSSTSKAEVDEIVLGRTFAIELEPNVVIKFTPTTYVSSAVVSSGWHRERYEATITLIGTIRGLNSSVYVGGGYTLYRAAAGVGGDGGGYTDEEIDEKINDATGGTNGVAGVKSFVLYQAPTIPLDSTIAAVTFRTMVDIINNPSEARRDTYRVPTALATLDGVGIADGNYECDDIVHNGATRKCLILNMKESLDNFSNIRISVSSDPLEFPAPNKFGAAEIKQYTATSGPGYSIQNLISQASSTHRGFVVFSDGDKKIYIYQTGTADEYLGWVNFDRIGGSNTVIQQVTGAEIDDTAPKSNKVYSSQKTEEVVDAKFEVDSVPDWLQYFDRYYATPDGIDTDIPTAGEPVVTRGATFVNGVFTFTSTLGSSVLLPDALSAKMNASTVTVFGTIANSTGSDLHPILFESGNDGRPLLTRWNTGGGYLNIYGPGPQYRLSADGTFPNNVDIGVGAVLRDSTVTGWINGVEHQTASVSWGWETDDAPTLGENNTSNTNGNYVGTQKQMIFLTSNAAYDRLSASDKVKAENAAAAWATTNNASKNLGEKTIIDLKNLGAVYKPIETKKDVFISPAHFVPDTAESSRRYVAVKAGSTAGDLDVGTSTPTPSEAGATEYLNINIAIPIADWDKCHKVGIGTSHATSVMLNAEEFIYKDEITSAGTENQLASSDGRNSARVRLYENQNQLGSSSTTTHRLEIAGTIGRVYIGKVRLVSLELS